MTIFEAILEPDDQWATQTKTGSSVEPDGQNARETKRGTGFRDRVKGNNVETNVVGTIV